MAELRRELFNSLKRKGFSPFQIRVYRAASGIPYGETRTYKWIAQRVNSPRSYRAVGQALKKNPYPVLIPCHRVIKSDGSLGGFARGNLAKIRLLKSEGIDIIESKIGG